MSIDFFYAIVDAQDGYASLKVFKTLEELRTWESENEDEYVMGSGCETINISLEV